VIIKELFILIITLDKASLLSTAVLIQTDLSLLLINSVITLSLVFTLLVFLISFFVTLTLLNISFGYVFNSESAENIAVYFGQTTVTGSSLLAKQYTDLNINIMILAFVVSQNVLGGLYSKVNFRVACDDQTFLIEKEAPGLYSVLSWQPILTLIKQRMARKYS
jgi:hypothetical protein